MATRIKFLGLPQGFMKIARDETERHRAEEALKELNATLEQRVEERSEALQASQEQLRYVTQQATDADSALDVERTMDRLDLLVTDIGLPGVNGRQLAEMMRERRPGLKVLFITGYDQRSTAKGKLLDEGMDMLAKPFTIDALAHKIKAMLDPFAGLPRATGMNEQHSANIWPQGLD